MVEKSESGGQCNPTFVQWIISTCRLYENISPFCKNDTAENKSMSTSSTSMWSSRHGCSSAPETLLLSKENLLENVSPSVVSYLLIWKLQRVRTNFSHPVRTSYIRKNRLWYDKCLCHLCCRNWRRISLSIMIIYENNLQKKKNNSSYPT
jgi:hypothetical protein